MKTKNSRHSGIPAIALEGERALKAAVAEVVAEHKKTKKPLAVWSSSCLPTRRYQLSKKLAPNIAQREITIFAIRKAGPAGWRGPGRGPPDLCYPYAVMLDDIELKWPI